MGGLLAAKVLADFYETVTVVERDVLVAALGNPTEVDIADGGEPVVLDSVGLQRLLDGLRTLGIEAEHFPWPPIT
jgi:hypothetical protein